MALNLTLLFGDLGALVARLNSYQTLGATTLPADLALLVAQFDDRWLPAEGVASTYEQYRDDVSGWRDTLAGYCDRRLLDRDTVLDELALDSADLPRVLAELDRYLREQGQTVKACSCSLGAVTPASLPVNHGTGTAFATLTLDGYSKPGLDMPANIYYEGKPSELTVPAETMVLTCLTDSMQNGVAEGAESFRWDGGPHFNGLDVRTEGSGPGPILTVANANSLIVGRDFESFSSGVPTGWTRASGTTAQESTVAFAFRGTYCVRFDGDAVLHQSVSPSRLQSRRQYHLAVALRASLAWAPAVFRAYFYSADLGTTQEVFRVAGANFPVGSWSLFGGFTVMPSPVPDDWALYLEVSGMPSTEDVWVDSLSFDTVVYHGGVGCVVVAGGDPWQKNDRLTFTVANNQAGKFQDFFRRHYRVQLPSIQVGVDPSAMGLLAALQPMGGTLTTSTISDSLVA